MEEKIDVVYTWVDGSDPIWREKRSNTFNNIKDKRILSEYSNVEGRFRDNQELKYSLRSLEKYFPDHGDIYIITDDQIPDFLNLNKIKIIFHKDFMYEHSLPTFSSKNIISQIPNISEIGDRFLLFNDDIFLGPKFGIDDFFQPSPVFYLEDSISQDPSKGEIMLKEEFPSYCFYNSLFKHSPKPIIKDCFFEMRRIFPTIFDSISREDFRVDNNPSSIGELYSYRMLFTGKGSRSNKNNSKYLESKDLLNQPNIQNFEETSFFCINDTSDNFSSDPNLKEIPRFLEKLFPEKSSFEK